jgi:predicted alpha/beta-hydrolase family hydrolase
MKNFPKVKKIRFEATESSGTISALMLLPDDPQWMLVLAHGAGAGMRHKFMEAIAARLADVKIGTFRYQFPYMEKGSRRPDPKSILLSTVCSAVSTAAKLAPDLPLLAGGKSMGGRMTSMAAAQKKFANVRGLVFVGFPLHPPGRPSVERSEHLRDVGIPMLFLQGTQDTLADLKLLKPICKQLGGQATLHVVDGADHSFHVPKSSGTNDDQVLVDLAMTTRKWGDSLKSEKIQGSR